MASTDDKEIEAMKTAHEALVGLKTEEQQRVLKWLTEKLAPTPPPRTGLQEVAGGADTATRAAPTGDGEPTAKLFLAQKRPKTDSERVACLAYYLTHHRKAPQFGSEELGKLQTEASIPPLRDMKTAVANATSSAGYLAPAGQGQKQITVRGEAVVGALPDRDAVKQAMSDNKLRRRRKRADKSTTATKQQ